MQQAKPATLARIYHYLLGGMRYFPADKAAADALVSLCPALPRVARANRAFLRRAVGYVAGQGVRRFLDIGCGLPTEVNVHDLVVSFIEDGRVLYVDVDPVAVGEHQELLDGHPSAAAIWGDLADSPAVLDHPQVQQLLDGAEPVALLVGAVLHFLPDQSAYPAVAHLLQALPAGSFVVVSHACPPTEKDLGSMTADGARAIYEQYTGMRLHLRCRRGVARFLHGLELVDPGLVWLPQWRPDPADPPGFAQPSASAFLVGVGRTPAAVAVTPAPPGPIPTN